MSDAQQSASVTSTRILLVNGPNLDQLGTRDPALYGSTTLEELVGEATRVAAERGFELVHVQSADEATIVTAIHDARSRFAAIVINAGAFTHYAWSIRDALDLFTGPVVELHVTNVAAREPWRHTSVVAPVATALIAGMGGRGYSLATQAAIDLVQRS